MGKAYIGETVLVQEDQIINNAPTKVLTLNEDDEITVSEIGNVRGVESVTGDAVDNTDPKNPIVNEAKDLPVDFIVSCTYDSTIDQTESQGKLLTYRIEGVNYTLNLKEVLADKLPVEFPIIKVIHNIAASDINTNRYVISGNILNESGAQGRRFVATLEGRLVDTKWVIEKTDFIVLSGYLNNSFHGHTVIGDNIYYMPRYSSTSTQNRILRFNMSNLADNKTLIFPLSAPYVGNSTCLDNHQGFIYALVTTTGSNPIGTMVRINDSLDDYEPIFAINGNDTDTALRPDPYFIINDDEILIPTVNDVNDTYEKYHSIGLSVYTMNGELKRKKVGMDLNLGYDPTSQPLSHWIGMFNNKMIISYTDGATATAPLRLVRLEVGYGTNNSSINLEESIWSFGTKNFTNDNFIDLKGNVYLSPEGDASGSWYKVYYKDFTNVEVIASNYWSLGMPIPKNRKTVEKVRLSQFGEWNKVTKSISVNGGTPSVPDPFTGNINITVSGGGGGETNLTYTAAPTNGTVNSDTGTDATIPLADNTNAGLMPANFYVVYPETAYTETVTWGGTAPVTMQNSTWQATKIGNRLSLRMNISYATAGTGNTTAQVPLPTGVPLPSSITGFTNNNSYMAVGSAAVSTGITSNPTISRAVLRRETGTTYSVYNSFSSGAYNTIIIDIEYFTD